MRKTTIQELTIIIKKHVSTTFGSFEDTARTKPSRIKLRLLSDITIHDSGTNSKVRGIVRCIEFIDHLTLSRRGRLTNSRKNSFGDKANTILELRRSKRTRSNIRMITESIWRASEHN